MKITDYGFFTVREPLPGNVVLLFENEDGQDWYDLRRTLTEWDDRGAYVSAVWPTWALADADGTIWVVDYDPSRLMPGDKRVLGIDAPIEDIKPGMIYSDGALQSPEEPT